MFTIHRTSTDKEKSEGKPKGLWCGQKVLPHTEAQTHTDDMTTCIGCLSKIREVSEKLDGFKG